MKMYITTQYMENYAAHSWDGTGECPQGWKYKGGDDYFVINWQHLDEDQIWDRIRSRVEWRDNYSESYVIGWEWVDDDYQTEFERSQIEVEGQVIWPTTVFDMEKI